MHPSYHIMVQSPNLLQSLCKHLVEPILLRYRPLNAVQGVLEGRTTGATRSLVRALLAAELDTIKVVELLWCELLLDVGNNDLALLRLLLGTSFICGGLHVNQYFHACLLELNDLIIDFTRNIELGFLLEKLLLLLD